jgi:RHS repeat-associated protein
MYQPTLGRFLSRDPLSENGLDVLTDTGFYSDRLAAMSANPRYYGGHWDNPYVYARNNPLRWVDPSGLFCQVLPCAQGENRECISRAGAKACRQALDCGIIATALSRRTGLPGAHNGPQDAVRHCILSCCMAATSGPKSAKIIGDLHEECGGNPGNEICMDLQNNSVGRKIGADIKRGTDVPTTCLSKCKLALADKKLAPAPFGNCAPPGPPSSQPVPKYP